MTWVEKAWLWLTSQDNTDEANAYNDEQAQKKDLDRFNLGLESFRKKNSFMGIPEDFKAIRSGALDPSRGIHNSDNISIDRTTGQPIRTNSNTAKPDIYIGFGTNGFSFYANPLVVVAIAIDLYSQNNIKNTKDLKDETKLETEKYNQKRHKHKDLFFNIVKNNQTGRIFAGGDLYNAGAGSKQYDLLNPYEPYKYFMEQSDISLEDIRAIIKDELPKPGKQSYYPGVDSEIEWAGGNKNIRGSQLIFNTSLRTTYQKFKEASEWWQTGVYGYKSLEFNYSLNDLLNRRIKAMMTDFKLKNKS